jgi:hypothetical protein
MCAFELAWAIGQPGKISLLHPSPFISHIQGWQYTTGEPSSHLKQQDFRGNLFDKPLVFCFLLNEY